MTTSLSSPSPSPSPSPTFSTTTTTITPHITPQFSTMPTQPAPAPDLSPTPTEPISDPMPPVTSPPPLPTPSKTPTQSLPSKLPSRPRKIRKLSPTSTATPTTTTTPKSTTLTSKTPTAPPPTRPLSAPGEISAALTHLRAADPNLSRLIDLHQPPTFDASQTPFLALTKSILYQQLAYKAGTSIYSRFIALCGGDHAVLPSTVLSLSPQQLRQIGVSARKASYLHDLARKYTNGILSDKAILAMDDKSLFTMLTMVNGIGSWSVHMFMIFSLHRPDVLPVNDLQFRKGVQLLYGSEDLPRSSQMDQLCEKWRPYRSVGAWYMWRFVEAKGAPPSSSSSNSGVVSMPHPRPHQAQALQPALAPQPLQVMSPGSQQLQQQQHQHHQQHQQMSHHSQFVDPVNSIMNMGSNYAQLN